eukprot:3723218-Alexandrium_andersonii.AAC.1
MSASLVGSEMCIRDSPATAPTMSVPTRKRCSTFCRPRKAAPWTACGAVSYTHLTLPTICSV